MPDFSQFDFGAPGWLALLLLLPVLALLRGRRGGRPAVKYSSTHVLKSLGKKIKFRGGMWANSLFLLGLAFLIVALARPRSGGAYTEQRSSGVDIMLVIDISGSMLAEDFETQGQRANRLEAVKIVTEQFITKRGADRIGMVGFAGQPFVVSPLTLDHNWLIQRLYKLNVGLVEDGTAIGSAIAAAANRLKDHESKSKIMVLLTDGSNNSGKVDPITAAEAAAAVGIKIYTIGAGTEGQVPMPTRDIFGRKVYEMVEVGFDEATLKEIARIGDGRYFRATGTESLAEVYDEIDQLEKTEYRVEQYVEYDDLYPYAAGIGLFLICLPLFLQETLWRKLP